MSAPGLWPGARGLADDVRYYGQWMRDRAWERIGHLYPKVGLPKGHGGEATVIAWLWARTVRCPNPACGAQMPLVRSFALSSKPGKGAWVQPITDHRAKVVRFEVRLGNGAAPEGTVNRRGARCLICGTTATLAPTQDAAKKGLEDRQIKLGCVQPGEVSGTFGDALRKLADQATYLYIDGSRYWYSTQPSVNRLADERAIELISRYTNASSRELVPAICECANRIHRAVRSKPRRNHCPSEPL